MQYILSEEEYNALKAAALSGPVKGTTVQMSRNKLQKLCTDIANGMPIKWIDSNNETFRPWGCILTKTDEWYCDQCPVVDICPSTKQVFSQ